MTTGTAYRRKPNQPIKETDKRLKENRDKPPANVATETGLPELLDHQRMAISVPDDHWLLMAGGRGGGKSWTLALLLVRDALRYGKSFRGALLRTDLAGLKEAPTINRRILQFNPATCWNAVFSRSKDL